MATSKVLPKKKVLYRRGDAVLPPNQLTVQTIDPETVKGATERHLERSLRQQRAEIPQALRICFDEAFAVPRLGPAEVEQEIDDIWTTASRRPTIGQADQVVPEDESDTTSLSQSDQQSQDDADLLHAILQEMETTSSSTPSQYGRWMPGYDDLPEHKQKMWERVWDYCDNVLGDKVKLRGFVDFVGKYREPIVRALLEHGLRNEQKLYRYGRLNDKMLIHRLDENGRLIQNGAWESLFDSLMFRLVRCPGSPEVELFLVVMYRAASENHHWIQIFEALLVHRDLSRHRYLLFLGGLDASKVSRAGHYALVVGAKEDRIAAARASGRWQDCEDPDGDLLAYGGMSYDSMCRIEQHWKKDPVNREVAAQMKKTPRENWETPLVLAHPNQGRAPPVAVQHLLEHFQFCAFRLTVRALGGLNINILDGHGYQVLLMAATLRDIAKAIVIAFEVDPTLRLPVTVDQQAWNYAFQSLVPQLPIKSTSLHRILIGLTRTHALKSLDLPALSRALWPKASSTCCPVTAEWSRAKYKQYSSYAESNPVTELERLRVAIDAAVKQIRQP